MISLSVTNSWEKIFYTWKSEIFLFPKWLFAHLPHIKCIRLGSVGSKVTSHLKCISCVQVSMYLRRRANSHDLLFCCPFFYCNALIMHVRMRINKVGIYSISLSGSARHAECGFVIVTYSFCCWQSSVVRLPCRWFVYSLRYRYGNDIACARPVA